MNEFMDTRRRQVLVVDDEEVNRQMLSFILAEQYEVLSAANGVEGMAILKEKKNTIALVMLDLLMPEMDGYEFLRIRHEDEDLRMIPVIVLTSEERSELRTLKLGASDFLKKPYDMPEIIHARVDRLVELTENRRVIQSTERDRLTGLYTKQYFFEYITMRENYFPSHQMDVVALNIEKFHLVNEVFGREFGDRVLKTVAGIISDYLDDNGGFACRSNADWFYLYMECCADYQKMIDSLQMALDRSISEVHVRLRMGVNGVRKDQAEIERRCDWAKTACDTIKDDYTKNLSVYDTAMHEHSLLSIRLINEVDAAILDGQFAVYYQPKYDITGNKPKLKSAEALVRWQHPELGLVSPGTFIPLFEKNGLIQRVDYHVWRTAASQVSAWKKKYDISLPVSVNISRIDLYDPALEEKLTGILEEFGLSHEEYYLEVTESAYVGDQKFIAEAVKRLRRLGFKIEMDDFGSGYSSLNSLSVLPVDVLKMDMKLVQNIHTDYNSLHIAEAVLDIAHFMDLKVVAEGAEEERQVELLKNAGCDIVQGWYFSKPLPPEEFEKLIEAERA